MQAVSALTRRMSEPNFTAGSVKARILETIHKLNRSAYRAMIFSARISTDETVATALEALVRDRFLTCGPQDLYELTDAGRLAIDVQPGAQHSGKTVAIMESPRGRKKCRKCHRFKDPQKDFGRAPRAPDGRTFDCNECRGVATAVVIPIAPRAELPAATSTVEAEATNQVVDTPEPNAVPQVLSLPTVMGFYVKIEGERVFINQPGQECQALSLNRERGLALGRFLCKHLGK